MQDVIGNYICMRQDVVCIQTESRSHYHSTQKMTKGTTNETLLATSIDPAASGGVIAPVEDSGEMTQVYFIMLARRSFYH